MHQFNRHQAALLYLQKDDHEMVGWGLNPRNRTVDSVVLTTVTF
jgi:hypothetical protein